MEKTALAKVEKLLASGRRLQAASYYQLIAHRGEGYPFPLVAGTKDVEKTGQQSPMQHNCP